MKDGRTSDSLVPARLGEEHVPYAVDVLQGEWTHLLAENSSDIVITPNTAVRLLEVVTPTPAATADSRMKCEVPPPPAAATTPPWRPRRRRRTMRLPGSQ